MPFAHRWTGSVSSPTQEHLNVIGMEKTPASQHLPRADQIQFLSPLEDSNRDPHSGTRTTGPAGPGSTAASEVSNVAEVAIGQRCATQALLCARD